MPPFTLPNKVYDTIKWLLIIVVPAFGTFYGILADELGLGHTESVLKILFAFAAFLGIVLGISNAAYNNSDEKYDGSIDPYLANNSVVNEILDIPEANGYSKYTDKKELLLKVKPSARLDE